MAKDTRTPSQRLESIETCLLNASESLFEASAQMRAMRSERESNFVEAIACMVARSLQSVREDQDHLRDPESAKAASERARACETHAVEVFGEVGR